MRFAKWAFCLALLSATAWTQVAPPPVPVPPAPPPPHMQGPMHSHHHMSGRGMPMPDMKAQVEKMRATLDQMRANLAKVKDPALKQQAQFDVDLWEAMVEHMENMVQMMSDSPNRPMGHMHHGMGCCGGMHKGEGCCCGGMKPGEGGKCMHGDGSGKVVVPAD